MDHAQCAAVEAAARLRDDRAIARALRILQRRACKPGQAMGDVATCGAFFRLRLAHEKREHFEVAFLDAQHRLLAVERLFSGTIDGANVHPRIVLQRALALNAGAVILAHNHPSGKADPSTADRAITTRLQEALGLVDIRLLDHFIVTADRALSMAALGIL
ncbi:MULTISPECIES: JAB domain-containing protein [Stenotrophomonas]